MKGKMKALVLHGKGDLRLDELDIPEIGPRDVLLQSNLVSVCGSDLHPFKVGERMAAVPNVIGGHEYMATVAEVGSEITKYKVGDRVLGYNLSFCGECWYCQHGDGHCVNVLKQYTSHGWPGAFAQYFKFVDPEREDALAPYMNSLMKLPDELTDEQVTLIEPFSIGLSAVESADVQPGQLVVVLGSGIIANSTMQWAKSRGATVVIVGRSKRRLDCARELGADYIIDNTKGDCYEQIAALFGAPGFVWGKEATTADVVFDCAGYPGSFNDALRIVRAGGTVCAVAYYEEPSMVNPQFITVKDLKILGMNGNNIIGSMEGILNGTVKVEPLIDGIVPLAQYMDVYQKQIDGTVMKLLIDMRA